MTKIGVVFVGAEMIRIRQSWRSLLVPGDSKLLGLLDAFGRAAKPRGSGTVVLLQKQHEICPLINNAPGMWMRDTARGRWRIGALRNPRLLCQVCAQTANNG